MSRRVVIWIDRPTIDDDHLGAVRLIRWLADAPDLEVDVVVSHDGPLLGTVRETADVLLLDDLNSWRVARTASSLGWSRLSQLAKGVKLRWWLARRRRADLTIAVGIAAADTVASLPLTPRHFLLLAEGRATVEDAGRPARTKVKRVLGHRTAAAVDVVLDTPDLFDDDRRSIRDRAEIGAEPEDLVVGAVGSTSWWEAPEQFVLWAWLLRARHPDLTVRLRWLTHASARELWPLTHDLRIAGDPEATIVNRPDFLDAIPLLDVLVLSGRGESAPLLATAALRRGVAVVATDNLDGIVEIDGVRVVPYLDLHALVDAVAATLADGVNRGPAQELRSTPVRSPLDLLAALDP